jgi:hypothetical protein
MSILLLLLNLLKDWILNQFNTVRYLSFGRKTRLTDLKTFGLKSVLILRYVLNLFLPITLLSLNSNLCQKSKYLFWSLSVTAGKVLSFEKVVWLSHMSNCNLNIEKGRYLKLSVEQRICQLCHTDVEDEFHFLMNCDKLIHERVSLFRNISDIVYLFWSLSVTAGKVLSFEKVVWLSHMCPKPIISQKKICEFNE